jgi:hypothetical protein
MGASLRTTAKRSACEVLAMKVVGTDRGWSREKELLNSFRQHDAYFFPVMAPLDRSTFVRRAAKLWAVKERVSRSASHFICFSSTSQV